MNSFLKLTADEARQMLSTQDLPSIQIFEKNIEVRFFIPSTQHEQKTHSRDELYMIITGQSEFRRGEDKITCQAGDIIFIPAQVGHEFINWSEDFSVWVIFFN